MLSGSDISFVLSGGSINSDPALSLGGDPSDFPITENLNSVFSDVTPALSRSGLTDYRCIYVFNNNSTYSLHNTIIYIQYSPSGAAMSIGLPTATDIQKITIVGDPDPSGNMAITYDTITQIVPYVSDLGSWQDAIQNALNGMVDPISGLPVLSGVVVLGSYIPATLNSAPRTTFVVRFLGDDNNKNHPLLSIENNLGGDTLPITVDKIQQGGPINAIASPIGSATIVPGGITFTMPSEDTPIVLGTLKPAEGFPIWIKRVTSVNPTALENDTLILTINGSPL